MGMVLEMRTLSDGNIAQVLNDPPLIWKVLAPDDPDPYERARADERGFWARFIRSRRAPAVPQNELATSAEEGVEADLDKARHGIHYLLTQSARHGEEPLDFLVAGGAQGRRSRRRLRSGAGLFFRTGAVASYCTRAARC